jgi:hypothetical protein
VTVTCLEKPPEVDARPENGRLALKRAQAELQAAQAELTRCSAARATCDQFVNQWDADVAKADKALADHARLNAELIASGEAPTVDDGLAQIKARAEAARSDLVAPRRHLEADAKAAAAAVERAKVKVNAQIEALVTARAIAEANELAEMWRDVWRRYDLLDAFCELRFPRPNVSPNPMAPFASSLQLISMPGDTVKLIQTLAGLDHRWGRSTAKERNATRLDAWRRELAGDADAEM